MDRVANRFIVALQQGISNTYNDRIRKIELELQKVHRKFFKVMAMKTMDVKNVPSLGSYTPEWKQLSKKYKDKKLRMGRSPNFYSNTGDLKRTIQGLNATTVLGAPLVRLGGLGQNLVKRTETWTFKKTNTQVTRTVIRNQGSFATSRILNQNLPKGITITPFPKVVENALSGMLNESDYFSEDIATKLKNPKGRRLRPLFTNYLNWYIDTEIRKAINIGMKK